MSAWNSKMSAWNKVLYTGISIIFERQHLKLKILSENFNDNVFLSNFFLILTNFLKVFFKGLFGEKHPTDVVQGFIHFS